MTMTCYDCGEHVVSATRNGWATLVHADAGQLHPVRVRSKAPQPAGPPVPHIVDHGAHFAVYVDDRDGRPWRLAGTTPTNRGAAYPEARERGYAAGLATAQGWAMRYGSIPPVETL